MHLHFPRGQLSKLPLPMRLNFLEDQNGNGNCGNRCSRSVHVSQVVTLVGRRHDGRDIDWAVGGIDWYTCTVRLIGVSAVSRRKSDSCGACSRLATSHGDILCVSDVWRGSMSTSENTRVCGARNGDCGLHSYNANC